MVRRNNHKVPFRHFIISVKDVLTIRQYLIFLITLSISFYILLIAFPAKTIPGNNFSFQLSLMRMSDHLLLAFLSFLTGLNLTFHLYLFKRKKGNFSPVKTASDSFLGIFSGLIASVFGTATCGACVATIFGYFGFGVVLFLLTWRLYIVGLAILLSLISLYYLSLKITNECTTCKI